MSTTTPGTLPTTPTAAAEVHAAALARATELAEGLNTWDLARMANCGRPEIESEGGDALRTARDVATEACAEHLAELDPAEAVELAAEGWELVQAVSDSIHEGVDGSGILTYTWRYRDAFAELDGWEEDPAGEFGAGDCGMDKLAQLAVFSIMRRCAEAVAERYAEAYTEHMDDNAPEDDDADD